LLVAIVNADDAAVLKSPSTNVSPPSQHYDRKLIMVRATVKGKRGRSDKWNPDIGVEDTSANNETVTCMSIHRPRCDADCAEARCESG
jgi:hypothetical protein